MLVTLKYHQPGEPPGTVSPIDEAIDQMVRGQHVDIVCPYIGLPYLKRIIKQASSWRLLSDVDQWIISQAQNSRSKIYDFITAHSESIRHYPDLHAKVIIAENKALVGSANFTEKGMTKRIEMCTLFENKRQVEELRDWFNGDCGRYPTSRSAAMSYPGSSAKRQTRLFLIAGTDSTRRLPGLIPSWYLLLRSLLTRSQRTAARPMIVGWSRRPTWTILIRFRRGKRTRDQRRLRRL